MSHWSSCIICVYLNVALVIMHYVCIFECHAGHRALSVYCASNSLRNKNEVSSQVGCVQDVAAPSSSEPKRSIFAREFYRSAGLIDSSTATQMTNQKSAEMSHDPISGTTHLPRSSFTVFIVVTTGVMISHTHYQHDLPW